MKHLFYVFIKALPLSLVLQTGFPLRAQIVNIEEARITGTNDSTWWYGQIKGSASVTKVAQQSLQFNAEVRVSYKRDPHMVLWLADASLLRAGNEDFTRQVFAHTRYNYKLSPAWSTEAFVQVQTNPLQLLRSRSLAGAGLRWRAFKSADGRQRLYLGAATILERNRYAEPYPGRDRSRFSSYVSITLRPGKHVVIFGTTYWQPLWGAIKIYRFSSDWSLQITIGKHLSFVTEYTYNEDRDLPDAASGITYIWQNGLIWHF